MGVRAAHPFPGAVTFIESGNHPGVNLLALHGFPAFPPRNTNESRGPLARHTVGGAAPSPLAA
ncbi:MAG: hypothetical protein OXF26_13640, partial [Alphaproteobacteria bacterium]|nr:hypothetical protein [Alphaproteobacteria bacterium]